MPRRVKIPGFLLGPGVAAVLLPPEFARFGIVGKKLADLIRRQLFFHRITPYALIDGLRKPVSDAGLSGAPYPQRFNFNPTYSACTTEV